MNQPTEDRIKKIEEQQKNFEKRLQEIEQQQTEPIKVTRIEIEQPHDDEQDRLLLAHSRGISNLQTEMQGARADIMSIKATQSDHGELLKTMATKDDVSRLESIMMQILKRLPRAEE